MFSFSSCTWWICSIVICFLMFHILSVLQRAKECLNIEILSLHSAWISFFILSYFLLFFCICYSQGLLLISFFHGWHLFPLIHFRVHVALFSAYFMPYSHFLTTFFLKCCLAIPVLFSSLSLSPLSLLLVYVYCIQCDSRKIFFLCPDCNGSQTLWTFHC